jgi:hypothetical protein
MKQYRIKIIERHNGQMSYTPQVGMLNIWSSILTLSNATMSLKMYELTINPNLGDVFESEEEALKVINQYKKQEEIHDGFKIKEITYKDIL